MARALRELEGDGWDARDAANEISDE